MKPSIPPNTGWAHDDLRETHATVRSRKYVILHGSSVESGDLNQGTATMRGVEYHCGGCHYAIVLLLITAILLPNLLLPQQVQVRHKEGLVHGFLVLRTPEGKFLADGDLIQNVHGDRVTSHLVFHFTDGSLNDETTVFSQRGQFRLISDHLIQKGPAFEHPADLRIEAPSGQIVTQSIEDGKERSLTKHLNLQSDLANGLLLILLKNIRPDVSETKLSLVVADPKPQLVTLHITPKGEESFTTGEAPRKAMHYVVRIDIGALKGAFASLLGKEPHDIGVWILEGEAPAFVRFEGPLAPGGPVWRIELVSPAFTRSSVDRAK